MQHRYRSWHLFVSEDGNRAAVRFPGGKDSGEWESRAEWVEGDGGGLITQKQGTYSSVVCVPGEVLGWLVRGRVPTPKVEDKPEPGSLEEVFASL